MLRKYRVCHAVQNREMTLVKRAIVGGQRVFMSCYTLSGVTLLPSGDCTRWFMGGKLGMVNRLRASYHDSGISPPELSLSLRAVRILA